MAGLIFFWGGKQYCYEYDPVAPPFSQVGYGPVAPAPALLFTDRWNPGGADYLPKQPIAAVAYAPKTSNPVYFYRRLPVPDCKHD